MEEKRLALLLGALSCFGCSSTSTTSTHTEEPITNHPVLLRLEGRDETIVIKAAPGAPLYSVLTSAGEVVVQDMTLTDLAVHDSQLYDRVRSAIAATHARIDGPFE